MENNLPFDKKLIGKFLSVGAENIVYYYNNDKEVIKFPLIISLRYLWDPEKYCNALKNSYELLRQLLPENINQSNIHIYRDKKKVKYVIIEPFIDGKALTKQDLKDEVIKKQFLEIISAKNVLEKEDVFLDLFGVWGLFFWGRIKVPNVLIEKNTKKLFVVDIGTADLKDSRFIISILLKFAYWKQNRFLKYYLK